VPSVLAAVSWPAPIALTVVVVLALVAAAAMVLLAVLDRSVPVWGLAILALLEVAVLVLAVICVVAWVGGTSPAEPVVFVFYLLFCLAVPPAMVWWGRGEPGRWGSGVVAAAALVLAVLMLRVQQVWVGGA
jgi:hypothetical protein